MNKGESFIHVRFEREESMQSKKDVLAAELSLVNIMKSLGRYTVLRNNEIKLKTRLYREIKKIGTDIKRLETIMPEVEIPSVLKHHKKYQKHEHKQEVEEQEKEVEEKPRVKGKKEDSLESQLKEIQKKLKSLSS